jgi:hypothetical protein
MTRMRVGEIKVTCGWPRQRGKRANPHDISWLREENTVVAFINAYRTDQGMVWSPTEIRKCLMDAEWRQSYYDEGFGSYIDQWDRDFFYFALGYFYGQCAQN